MCFMDFGVCVGTSVWLSVHNGVFYFVCTLYDFCAFLCVFLCVSMDVLCDCVYPCFSECVSMILMCVNIGVRLCVSMSWMSVIPHGIDMLYPMIFVCVCCVIRNLVCILCLSTILASLFVCVHMSFGV